MSTTEYAILNLHLTHQNTPFAPFHIKAVNKRLGELEAELGRETCLEVLAETRKGRNSKYLPYLIEAHTLAEAHRQAELAKPRPSITIGNLQTGEIAYV